MWIRVVEVGVVVCRQCSTPVGICLPTREKRKAKRTSARLSFMCVMYRLSRDHFEEEYVRSWAGLGVWSWNGRELFIPLDVLHIVEYVSLPSCGWKPKENGT